MGWSYSLCTMGFTIEVTEVGVLAAIVCVLFLTVAWLLWSRRKQDEETKMLKKLLVQEKDSQRGNDNTNHKGSARLGHATKEIFESPSYLSNVDNSDSSQDDDDVWSVQRTSSRVLSSQQHGQSRHVQHVHAKPIQQPAQYTSFPVKSVTPLEQILQSAKCISGGSPSIYKISLEITKTATHGIEKGEVGTPHPIPKPTRVFMVVGATGAGKSTLINAMVNYLLGVRFEDDYRFALITDETKKTQAHSQTQHITSYTIYWQEGSFVDYNLTIVDTPGFCDTSGVEQDQKITSQIKDFFSLKGDGGIDQIHGIGFVTQSALARLTSSQKYVFNSILSVFGKDIANNIYIMSTFADGDDPPVKAAITAAEVPYCKFLNFNNKVILKNSTNQLDKSLWSIAYESFAEFFAHFATTKAVSLQLTKKVLEERQHLETIVTGLHKRISTGISKIDELNEKEENLKKNEAAIEGSKNFKFPVKFMNFREVDISGTGRYVTNCLKCNFTCHENCVYNNSDDKHKCSAMDNGGINNAKCRACPGNCHWKEHRNNSFCYEYFEDQKIETSESLKKRYQDASTKKFDVQKAIAKMEQELEDLHNQVYCDIQQVRQCVARLGEIALKPNPLTDVEYIGLLIESERKEKSPQFNKRIRYLNELKERAELMATLESNQIEGSLKKEAKNLFKKFRSQS